MNIRRRADHYPVARQEHDAEAPVRRADRSFDAGASGDAHQGSARAANDVGEG